MQVQPMTTDAETGNQIDAAAVWRGIGRLECAVAALKDGQNEIKADLRDGFREVNLRVDRLFYAMLGSGGALLVAMIASRIFGG